MWVKIRTWTSNFRLLWFQLMLGICKGDDACHLLHILCEVLFQRWTEVFAMGFMIFDDVEMLQLGITNYIIGSWVECPDPFPLPPHTLFFFFSSSLPSNVGSSLSCIFHAGISISHVLFFFTASSFTYLCQCLSVIRTLWSVTENECFLLFLRHSKQKKSQTNSIVQHQLFSCL